MCKCGNNMVGFCSGQNVDSRENCYNTIDFIDEAVYVNSPYIFFHTLTSFVIVVVVNFTFAQKYCGMDLYLMDWL